MTRLKVIKWAVLALLFALSFQLVEHYNDAIFHAINGWQVVWLAKPMVFLTALADGHFILLLAVLFYQQRSRSFYPALAGLFLTAVVVQYLKHYFLMPRPPLVYQADQFYLLTHLFLTNSFPSGHSASALALGRYLAEGRQLPGKTFYLSVAVLCAVSRVYVGIHFPIDVLTGGFIGYAIASLAIFSDKLLFKSRRIWFPRLAPLVANLLGVLVALHFLFYYDEKEPLLLGFLNFLAALAFLLFLARSLFYFWLLVRRKQETS